MHIKNKPKTPIYRLSNFAIAVFFGIITFLLQSGELQKSIHFSNIIGEIIALFCCLFMTLIHIIKTCEN